MNGSLRMHKSYTNNSNHTIKIPSNVNEYFSVDNNLKLDYYTNFNYNQLAEKGYNIDDERKFAVELFFEYIYDDSNKSIDDLKYDFFENSHRSFLYAKTMCQDLLDNGVHHPLGVTALNPLVLGSNSEKFTMDTGWRILSDDLVIFMYSGCARLRYFKLLGWEYVPVFLQSVDSHNINWDGQAIRIDSIDKLKSDYSDSVLYDTQFYQEEKFFYFMKHQLDEKNQSFNKLTDKTFGVDLEKECLSHLVCCDINNDHKVNGWNGEDILKYNRILKNSFPLKVYIGKCKSENSKEFIDCKNRILNSISKQKVDIEFRFIDEISDISKKNEKKGFAFYTDSNVKWDTNILELFYFTHSTKNITNYKDGVLIINCELEK